MKKLFLLLLLIPSISWAGMNPYVAGSDSVTACSQTKLHSQETVTGVVQIGQATNNAHRASSYTAGTNDSIKTLYVLLDKEGTDDASVVTVYLCPDNSGEPPNISTCTAADSTVAHSALSADAAYVKFNWTAGYAQTASTKYWIVVKFAYIDAAIYVNWSYNNTVTGEAVYRDTDGVPSYTVVDSSGQADYKAYNCLE